MSAAFNTTDSTILLNEGAKLSSYLARVEGSFKLFWSSYRGKLGDRLKSKWRRLVSYSIVSLIHALFIHGVFQSILVSYGE